MWRPRRVIVTHAARGFDHGRAIMARAAAAGIEVVELPGDRLNLAVPDDPGGMYRFCGIWRRDRPPGPAASWLLERMVELGAADVDLPGAADV